MITAVDQPCVISTLPGRVRLHLPDWPAAEWTAIEMRLSHTPGIRSVRANLLTRNVLIHYDPAETSQPAVVDLMRRMAASARMPAVDVVATCAPLQYSRAGSTLHLAGFVHLAPAPAPRVVARHVVAVHAPAHALLDLLVRGASAMLGLLLADSPLGLILGALELCRLLAAVTAQ